jgi:2-iminobutanoate/2-iminopropanoate deaminase
MRSVIRTEKAPAPIGPYSQGIESGSLVFTSGQVGVDPATGKLVEGGVEAETRRTLENLRAILAAAGSRLEDVVKVTIFLADLQEFKAFNAVYAEYFPAQPPARTTVGVAALPASARVEIDAIAVRR